MPGDIVAGIDVFGKRLAVLLVVGNGTSRDAKQLYSGLDVWQSFYEGRARQIAQRLWQRPGHQHQVRFSCLDCFRDSQYSFLPSRLTWGLDRRIPSRKHP